MSSPGLIILTRPRPIITISWTKQTYRLFHGKDASCGGWVSKKGFSSQVNPLREIYLARPAAPFPHQTQIEHQTA